MTVVRILVETIDKGFVANVHDDVGKVCDAFSTDRKEAVREAKRKASRQLGMVDEFRVEDL